jgi:biopolymer transport protein ExbD
MEFVRAKKTKLGLDMAPLIDIVFQILIFFMLTSSFLSPSLRLDLPKAISADSKGREAIVVSVTTGGSIFINTDEVTFDNFKSELTARISAQPSKAIHVKGDKEMPYKYFVRIMDEARQAGARQINVVHEQA